MGVVDAFRQRTHDLSVGGAVAGAGPGSVVGGRGRAGRGELLGEFLERYFPQASSFELPAASVVPSVAAASPASPAAAASPAPAGAATTHPTPRTRTGDRTSNGQVVRPLPENVDDAHLRP